MDTGIAVRRACNTRNEGVTGHRQARHGRAASDGRALQVRRRAHQAHAEDHHSRRRRRSTAGRSRRRSTSRPIRTWIAFWDDLGNAYKKAVRGFADAGCRYLQLDEVFIAMLCDPKYREQMTDARRRSGQARPALRRSHQRRDVGHSLRHDDHDASVPRQLQIDLHGRGRLRRRGRGAVQPASTCTAISWNTTPSAPAASSRCGLCRRASRSCSASSPPRPASSRARTTLKRRIDEAAKFVALDQLCLSPQCGFASTEEGNTLTEDEQWAKLRMIVEVADEVWGGSASSPSLRHAPGLSRRIHRLSLMALGWTRGSSPAHDRAGGAGEINDRTSSQDKVAIVTGAGRGIGRAIAHADGAGGRQGRGQRRRRGARRLGRRRRPGAAGGRRDQEGRRPGDRLDALDRRAAERRQDRAGRARRVRPRRHPGQQRRHPARHASSTA